MFLNVCYTYGERVYGRIISNYTFVRPIILNPLWVKIAYLPINTAYFILKNNVSKHLLFFFLFIFIFSSIGSIKADPTVLDELDVEVNTKEVTGLTFNSAGTRLFVTGSRGNDRVSEYSLSVGFDLSSTVTHLGFISNHAEGLGAHDAVRAETGGWRPQDIKFSNDGSKMFLPM